MGEKASNKKEQPTSSQVDSVLEGVASVFTKFSAQSDQTDESIQAVLKRTKKIDRRIDEIRTAEQLDSLTVDEEMELVRLQEEAEQLNNQYKSLLQEKKQADAKVKKLKRNKNGKKALRKRRRKCKTLTGKKKLVEQRELFLHGLQNLQTQL